MELFLGMILGGLFMWILMSAHMDMLENKNRMLEDETNHLRKMNRYERELNASLIRDNLK